MKSFKKGLHMNKLILLIVASVLTLFANGYEDAINQGIDENKNVLFMISTKNCPYCRSTKEAILPDEAVQEKLQNYVYKELDKDTDSYPKDTLYTRFVPSFFIINPKTQGLLAERIGYQPKSVFIEFLEASK